MSKKSVSMELEADAAKASETLSQIASAVKAGTVSIQKGDESVVLMPEGVVSIELEAVQKSEKEKIKIEISWEKAVVEEPEIVPELKISSKSPEA